MTCYRHPMRLALLVALTVALSASPAHAADDALQLQKATGLHVVDPQTQAGRHAVVRFMRREVRLERSHGFRIEGCARARRTTTCLIAEFGIPDSQHIVPGDRFDMEYHLRAKRVRGHWRVWSPEVLFD